MTKFYKTTSRPFAGTNYSEVYRQAFVFYKQIRRKSKRRPYVRSAYFNKEKVFLELFWQHLHQKNWRDRSRRVKYFVCSLELIQHSHQNPESKEHLLDHSQMVHRFRGMAPNGEMFVVQIREDKKSRQKWFMSCFPVSKDK